MNARKFAPPNQILGSVLLGRYRVVRELAKGGMGVVYLARAEGAVGFVKPVVVKLLLPEHAQDERFVRMFVREAQILSELRHPSIVDVLEFGVHEGAYVLVLQYVRGYHLGQWLRYLWMKGRVAPAEVLVQIVIDVLDALHHAHNLVHPDGSPMQIVHRDVSPSNILLDEDGRARLVDFGVARMRSAGQEDKTRGNDFMGKLPYTAPELFADGDPSPRSDLYACAVVLHEALLGNNVFRAEMQVATLQRVMTHVPEPLEPIRPGTPAGLDPVLGRALAKQSAARFANARDFAAALRELQQEQESDIRARLADLLKRDFGNEMAELLNLESLSARDEAWRRLNQASAATPEHPAATLSGISPNPPEQITTSPTGLPTVPAPAGATIARSPARTGGRKSRQANDSDELDAPDDGSVPAIATDRPSAAPAATASGAPPAEASSDSGTRLRPTGPSSRPAAPEATAVGQHTTNRAVWVGLCVVGALALGAIALSLRRSPAPTATVPPIQVVARPIAGDPPARPPTPPPQPVAAATSPAGPSPARPSPDETRAHAPTRARHGPDTRALTRAFRRRQSALERCFVQHSIALEGQPTTEIQFDIDARGKLTHVALAPAALASTALGTCLLGIARDTKFPAQGSPVSFAIPLRARGGARK